MFQDASNLATMAEVLSRSADYRGATVPGCSAPLAQPTIGQDCRTGILLDTETTGLDHAREEIIELGMVKFGYSADGRIVGVRDIFSTNRVRRFPRKSPRRSPASPTTLAGAQLGIC